MPSPFDHLFDNYDGKVGFLRPGVNFFLNPLAITYNTICVPAACLNTSQQGIQHSVYNNNDNGSDNSGGGNNNNDDDDDDDNNNNNKSPMVYVERTDKQL